MLLNKVFANYSLTIKKRKCVLNVTEVCRALKKSIAIVLRLVYNNSCKWFTNKTYE